jgi:Tfp pilus assembly protein PilX
VPPPHRLRLRGGDEKGAAILEFTLVVVLFMFLMFGLIAYGMILATKQRITNAASDGARAAVGAPDPVQAAKDRIHDALGAEGSYTLTPPPSLIPCVGGTGTCISVSITYDYANHPIMPVPELPGMHLFTPSTFGAKAVVQVS